MACTTALPGLAAKISVRYERPESEKYLDLYRSLKRNHKVMLGESSRFLNQLYDWVTDLDVVVAGCGYINSRFEPPGSIVICYETLYAKIYNYPGGAVTGEKFDGRVLQNVLFTFWHEIGHAVIHQFGVANTRDTLELEILADEFATLSMLWRSDRKWKDVLMISALHFKHKSVIRPDRTYRSHPNDQWRYEKMIVLLYGFAQKSYSRLSDQIKAIEWLDKSAQEYYLERSAYWKKFLWERTQRNYFEN